MAKVTSFCAAVMLLVMVAGCGNPHAEDPNGKSPPSGGPGTGSGIESNTDPAQNGLIHSGTGDQPAQAPGGSLNH